MKCLELYLLTPWSRVLPEKLTGLIIIIFINCNWVITRWQWLYYMYTNMGEKKVTRKFKSGGLHERHVVATWKLGNHLTIRL
jgi:hypothetical protein